MGFIELHYKGDPRLISIDKISAIGCDYQNTFVWLIGDSACFYVDESYDEIKKKIQEADFVWNV